MGQHRRRWPWMDIYVDRPASGAPWPAVVLTYHREGIDDFTKWVARQFAEAGYLVAVPEVAHRIPSRFPRTTTRSI